jgi:hypothetical protein
MRKRTENRLTQVVHQSIIDKGIKASSYGCMRTTITLEPDVAARLQKEAAKGEQTFKQIVNDALRRGLDPTSKPKKRFVQRTWDYGGAFPPWDQIKQRLLDDEIERFNEISGREPSAVRDKFE